MVPTRQEELSKKRFEYLLSTLESVEKRRIAVENKTSILLAANAIVFTALSSIWPLKVITTSISLVLIQIFFACATLICLVCSILVSCIVLSGPANDKSRGKILDIKGEYNTFYFGKIAERAKDEYLAEIEKLTDEQVFQQIGAQVHNVSRIVRDRYKHFNIAIKLFIGAMISFVVLAAIQAIIPVIQWITH